MSFSFRVIKILSRNFSVSVPLMRYCNTFPDFIALVWNHLSNEYFRISEIRLDMSQKDFFETKKGEKIQYAQYYLDRWGMKINDLDQPLLVSIPRVSKKNCCKILLHIYQNPFTLRKRIWEVLYRHQSSSYLNSATWLDFRMRSVQILI